MSRIFEFSAVFMFLLSFAASARCEDAGAIRREDALKAAYLFNFARFVDWPGEAEHTPLILCFIGGENVRRALANDASSKSIGTHPVSVRAISELAEMAGCSVLYVSSGASAGKPAPEFHDSVLTVSDEVGFARQGGIIELFTEGNRLRFIVNVANARRAGIRISSSLLQLASVVDKEGER